MTMRELMRERVRDGETRAKWNESERHEPLLDHLGQADRFALARDLDIDDLGTAARGARDLGEVRSHVIAGQNLDHS